MITVFFDVETGGLDIDHPIIQLAAIAVDDGWNEIATFEKKLKFLKCDCDVTSLTMNHFDEEIWEQEAIDPLRAIDAFAKFLDPFKCLNFISKRTGNPYSVAQLAGHNAATFDGPRLQRLFSIHRRFLPADPRVLCTLQRAMWFFRERKEKIDSYKLESLCLYFGIVPHATHDALADVRSTILLARKLEESK